MRTEEVREYVNQALINENDMLTTIAWTDDGVEIFNCGGLRSYLLHL